MRSILTLLLIAIYQFSSAQSDNPPNILFIFCDDLNASGLGALIDPNIYTPTIDSLVAQSAVFTNAHANATLCAPSRASIFTGLLPSSSGYFGINAKFEPWFENESLAEAKTVFAQMKENGYSVYAAGKVFHKGRNPVADFDHYYAKPFQGPYPFDNRTHSSLPEVFSPLNISFASLENVPSYPEGEGWFSNGQPFVFESDSLRDLLGDELSAQYADSIFTAHAMSDTAKPFFLTLGLFKPHAPFHVPQHYFDLYPLESIDVSDYESDETEYASVVFSNRANAKSNKSINTLLSLSPDEDPFLYLKKFKQGYYASISFIDDILKDILKSLKDNGLSDNTYIIFSSDHGYHLGSKRIVHKSTLWNDASHIPLVVSGPDISPSLIEKPVSLIDIYPTILDVAGVEPPESHELDGHSLSGESSQGLFNSALITNSCVETVKLGETGIPHHQHYAILSDKYKYILYSSGEDELYDVILDPNELVDLSTDPLFQQYRRLGHQVLVERVGDIRPPESSYNHLFYGDFAQELNGWIPSETDSLRYIHEPTSNLASEHLLIQDSTVSTTENRNLSLPKTKDYQFEFQGYSESAMAEVRIKLMVSRDGAVSALFNEVIALTDSTHKISFPFFYLQSGDDITFSLTLTVLSGNRIHVDDFNIVNADLRNAAKESCLTSTPMATDTLYGTIIRDTLVSIGNQPDFSTINLSGLTQQRWFKIIPTSELGLITVRCGEFCNAVIDIAQDCESFNLENGQVFDHMNEGDEHAFLESLIPSQEYFIRIANKGRLLSGEIPVTAHFQNLDYLKAQIQNGFFSTNSPEYPNLEIDSMAVQIRSAHDMSVNLENTIAYNENGIYAIQEFGIDTGIFVMRLSYLLNDPAIWIPWGPEVKFIHSNEEPSEQEELSASIFLLSPNPVDLGSNMITISRAENQSAYVKKIFFQDMTGRILSTYHIQDELVSVQINLPVGLSSGIYFLAINDNQGKRSVLKLRL